MTIESPSLLILSGVQRDPRRYRTFHLYEQARLAGLNCQLSHITDPALHEKVARASTVILHRAAYDAQVAWLEGNIHARGGFLVTDLDDLVFDPEAIQFIHSPDFADPVRRSLYLEDINRFRKTVEISDHVITSSDYLAERVRQLQKPASVHRNAFSLEMLSLAEGARQTLKKAPTNTVIGYASGTPTHDQDFALIKPVLKSLLTSHPEVELWLVGRLDPGNDWGESGSRIKRLDLVPWRKLPAIQAQFDINLASLQVDNPFGQSKSEIKYMEAGLLKVPTIASPSDSYVQAIRDGENGFLASSIQDWQRCLGALITDKGMRSRIGSNAYQDVLDHYHPAVRARQLVELLESISGRSYEAHTEELNPVSQPEKPGHQYWTSAGFETSPTLLQRGIYSLRYRNLQTLLKQVWIFIRRLVSPVIPYPKPR